jgi:hypothetical protein
MVSFITGSQTYLEVSKLQADLCSWPRKYYGSKTLDDVYYNTLVLLVFVTC